MSQQHTMRTEKTLTGNAASCLTLVGVSFSCTNLRVCLDLRLCPDAASGWCMLSSKCCGSFETSSAKQCAVHDGLMTYLREGRVPLLPVAAAGLIDDGRLRCQH